MNPALGPLAQRLRADLAERGWRAGKIVIDVGDILLPQKLYVRSAIELTVENGYATRIDGGVDAELLREYVASFRIRKPTRFRTSAGLQPRAHWTTLGLYDREATIGMDARAYEGNFLFSLGPNNEAGGSRCTTCHIDIHAWAAPCGWTERTWCARAGCWMAPARGTSPGLNP